MSLWGSHSSNYKNLMILPKMNKFQRFLKLEKEKSMNNLTEWIMYTFDDKIIR